MDHERENNLPRGSKLRISNSGPVIACADAPTCSINCTPDPPGPPKQNAVLSDYSRDGSELLTRVE